MLKYWKLMILLVMVLGAIFSIGLKSYPYGRNGIEVVYVAPDSPAAGLIDRGMIINNINEQPINNLDDWNAVTRGIKGSIIAIANKQNVVFSVGENESLGIDATDIERTNLNFGLDLRGGTRIILEPIGDNVTADDVAQTISTLETRANIYGLQEMKFTSLSDSRGGFLVQIEAAGVGKEVIENLLARQGDFEAKITRTIPLIDNVGVFEIGPESYEIKLTEDSIEVDGEVFSLDEKFILYDMETEFVNRTDGSALFMVKVYDGDDVELVYTDPQRSGINRLQNGYSFFFTVLVSPEGAQRFADVTKGLDSFLDLNSGSEYLNANIVLFLDKQVVSDLRISSGLQGQVYTSPQITGSRPTFEEAQSERLTLQTVLRSGALPVKLEAVSVDVISPTLGQDFFDTAIIAGIIAGIVVFIIVFVRYRSIKVSVPLVFIALSEVLIIVGISAANDVAIWGIVLAINILIMGLAWWKKQPIDMYVAIGALLLPIIGFVSWTIDLPAIGGIIAAIGTGVDHQIIIADETMSKKKRDYEVKENIRRAFFIIAGAALTTIAAMVPLMFLGIGLVRGFAITTIVGILVGILITRPAYARVVEILKNREFGH
ncbi:MAG: hypothetical protein ABIJ92_03190 [Candidatus Aenigmatarchaeota archaeon]